LGRVPRIAEPGALPFPCRKCCFGALGSTVALPTRLAWRVRCYCAGRT
jgi:hypothetical protein